jgi:glycosyltransferase involved in cell wall biosynthesis
VSDALIIAHVLGSFGIGGAERVALDLATEQVKLGYEVMAVSLSPDQEGPLGPEFRAAGVTVHTVPKRRGIDITLPPRVTRLFRREKVDVVHTHNALPLIYAAVAGRVARAVVVHTKHGQGHMGSHGQKLLRKLAASCVHWYVAVSEQTAQQARAQRDWLIPRRMSVIRNGIALDRFHPDEGARRQVRDELGIPAGARVVGTVGRCDWNKNQIGLVRAMAPLLADDVHLVMVGEGPSLDQVRAAARALSRADRVHVLGRRTDTARIMAALDIFAMSSLSEGLPLVIPEAMACGLPVVSTSVGGIPGAVTTGETGYLVPAGDDDALRARLRELLEDPEQARALGRAGRECALREYSAERMTRDYLEIYDRGLRAVD